MNTPGMDAYNNQMQQQPQTPVQQGTDMWAQQQPQQNQTQPYDATATNQEAQEEGNVFDQLNQAGSTMIAQSEQPNARPDLVNYMGNQMQQAKDYLAPKIQQGMQQLGGAIAPIAERAKQVVFGAPPAPAKQGFEVPDASKTISGEQPMHQSVLNDMTPEELQRMKQQIGNPESYADPAMQQRAAQLLGNIDETLRRYPEETPILPDGTPALSMNQIVKLVRDPELMYERFVSGTDVDVKYVSQSIVAQAGLYPEGSPERQRIMDALQQVQDRAEEAARGGGIRDMAKRFINNRRPRRMQPDRTGVGVEPSRAGLLGGGDVPSYT